MNMQRILGLVLCVLLVLPLLGCGTKEYGHVTGKVTLNGEPFEGATVQFLPVQAGRSSFAKTGPDGTYELEYMGDIKGATLGENRVFITTYEAPTLDDDNNVVEEGKPERFPPKYNESPSVTVTVEPGENVFDFDVKADQETYERSQDS